jgi:CheY-like chemotaxis protein
MTQFPGRIVLVDDDGEFRQMMRAGFETQNDIVFMTCQGGKELLMRLRELQPELVVLDLRMPETDGVDTIAALRGHEDGKDVPVIFLTSVKEMAMDEIYQRLGVIGVIHKPVTTADFPARIETIWNKAFPEAARDEDSEE